MRTAWPIILIIIVIAGSLEAQDIWGTTSPEPDATSSGHQIALGVGFRLDNRERVDAEPMLSGQYLWYASSNFALKVDLGFNLRTDISSNSHARTVAFGFGMRLQPSVASNMPQPFWTPFVEFDISTLRYDGKLGGRNYSEIKPGLGLAAGLSFKIEESATIDILVHQAFNNVERRVTCGNEPSILPQLGDFPHFWVGMGGYGADGLYNPTNLIVRYRVAL